MRQQQEALLGPTAGEDFAGRLVSGRLYQEGGRNGVRTRNPGRGTCQE